MNESETDIFWESKVELDRDKTESLVPLASRPRWEHDEPYQIFQILNIFGRDQSRDLGKDKQTVESETKAINKLSRQSVDCNSTKPIIITLDYFWVTFSEVAICRPLKTTNLDVHSR